MPYVKIFFLPKISAVFPKGTRKMAAAKKYEVATQFNITAFISNSLRMEGRAMLIEAPMKGVMKELMVAMIKAGLRFLLLTEFILGAIIRENKRMMQLIKPKSEIMFPQTFQKRIYSSFYLKKFF